MQFQQEKQNLCITIVTHRFCLLWTVVPQNIHPRICFKIGSESSEVNPVRKRRNSYQSAVFGEAVNGTAVGISELEWLDNLYIFYQSPAILCLEILLPKFLIGDWKRLMSAF